MSSTSLTPRDCAASRPASSELTVDTRWIGRRAVVRAGGEIDIATSDRLHAALDQAADEHAQEIWVDLSNVRFMDSTGLNILLALHPRVPRLAVICPEDSLVRRVFTLSGTDEVLPLYATRAHAQYHAA